MGKLHKKGGFFLAAAARRPGCKSTLWPGTYAAPDSAPSFVPRQKKAKTRLNLRFKNPLASACADTLCYEGTGVYFFARPL